MCVPEVAWSTKGSRPDLTNKTESYSVDPVGGVASNIALLPPKRRQVLAGAREVFAQLGFERASVDLIASRAGVSKATIYSHYENKTALFVDAVTYEADEMHAALRAGMAEPAGDVEPTLQLLGENMLRVFLSPSIVCLYRHIFAEAARVPNVGQMIFDRGLRVIHDTIASHLERWARDGALRIDDVRAAAGQFVALCQGDLVARARLAILGDEVNEELPETVRRAVWIFLRAYRP